MLKWASPGFRELAAQENSALKSLWYPSVRILLWTPMLTATAARNLALMILRSKQNLLRWMKKYAFMLKAWVLTSPSWLKQTGHQKLKTCPAGGCHQATLGCCTCSTNISKVLRTRRTVCHTHCFGKPTEPTGINNCDSCQGLHMDRATRARTTRNNSLSVPTHRPSSNWSSHTKSIWTRFLLIDLWKSIYSRSGHCHKKEQRFAWHGTLGGWLASKFFSLKTLRLAFPAIPESLITEDGMDQAKWRIPRYHGPHGQRPLKSTQMLARPQLKIQGCWVHGVVLDLWAPYVLFFESKLCYFSHSLASPFVFRRFSQKLIPKIGSLF